MAHTPPPVHPLASPVATDAVPEKTGGRRVGVLLSHGFTGQPASMKPLGEALAEHGYAVEVPRLPGHGTSWQDLNTTTWADWYGEIRTAHTRLADRCDVVVAGGLSMGGALVLRLAADLGDALAGVVVINPAVATQRLDVKLLPVLKHLVPSFPGIANDIKSGGDEHGYTRTPLKAAHSMMQAWPPLVADLPRVTAPLLYLRSDEDHVVDASSEPLITSGVTGEVTRVALRDSFHVATLDHDLPVVIEQTLAFVEKVTAPRG
ncbi:alpha/beta hydrolase [Nocardioides acrostichi]|uniref:Alpha/beta fold hydrolase n=1 Tax=Nocardioides acrostichi TaxID=2784339 RepID=A0A930UY69_9ACTN|nr:alpha/beta fold hydrolase [Nocardioides acrostichi]MBF4160574.1 alpha/beta fold hydrolase [Nocardioides acrostichi]